MADDGAKGKKVALMGISSLLLVAMVVAVTVGAKSNANKGGEISTSNKAVEAICQPTDFKETCMSSLAPVAKNTTDPKELIKASFEAAINQINSVASNSTLFKELEKDPETKKAVEDCKELFNDAIGDFRRSFFELGQSEFTDLDRILSDVKVWLSATVTYQETCLDGFENTTGDASEKMRKLLKTSMEMSSNGLAIVSEMSRIIMSMQITSFGRRLLSTSENGDANDVFTNIDSFTKWRQLLASNEPTVHRDQDYYDDDVHGIMNGRRLLNRSRRNGARVGVPVWLDSPQNRFLKDGTLMRLKPNVTVSEDGTGNYTTIADALTAVPKWNNDTFVIYIKEGVYHEVLRVEKWLTHVVFVGDGPTKTRISSNLNFIDGTPTFKTATLSVLADDFMARDIGVENTAGAIKHQAVALRVQADKAIFYNCHFDGYQDTLYAHTYRQFYRDCKISGTIDFVFGDAASFFQNCTFVVRKPLDNQNCIVTAQGRKERHQPSGIVIHKSRFTSDPEYYPVRFINKAYLGRPWKEYSKTIIMESHMEDLIQPEGWLPWMADFGLNTCYYGEYNNAGPGSEMTHRVTWRGIKTIIPSRAEKFMPPNFFGNFDAWIVESGVPYVTNLTTAPPPALAALSPGDVDEDPNAAITSISSDSNSSSSSPSDNQPKSGGNGATPKKSETVLPPSISAEPSPSPIPSGISSFLPTSAATDQASQQLEISTQGMSLEGSQPPQMNVAQSVEAEASQQPELKTQGIELEASQPPQMNAAQTVEAEASPQPQITLQPTENEVASPRVLITDFERVLMEDGVEDMAQNDDMMGNVPDGDEPSPALVGYSSSPVQAPAAQGLGVASSANAAGFTGQSPVDGPSLAPGQEDDDGSAEMSGPAASPEPSAEAADSVAPSPPEPEKEQADTAPAAAPTKSGSSKTTYGVQIILSGFAAWAALAM